MEENACFWSHNPKVEGSNPSPATKFHYFPNIFSGIRTGKFAPFHRQDCLDRKDHIFYTFAKHKIKNILNIYSDLTLKGRAIQTGTSKRLNCLSIILKFVTII